MENYLEIFLRTKGTPPEKFVNLMHETLYGGGRSSAPSENEMAQIISQGEIKRNISSLPRAEAIKNAPPPPAMVDELMEHHREVLRLEAVHLQPKLVVDEELLLVVLVQVLLLLVQVPLVLEEEVHPLEAHQEADHLVLHLPRKWIKPLNGIILIQTIIKKVLPMLLLLKLNGHLVN